MKVEQLKELRICYSCGFCGRPLDKNYQPTPAYIIPWGYDPEKYAKKICIYCGRDYIDDVDIAIKAINELSDQEKLEKWMVKQDEKYIGIVSQNSQDQEEKNGDSIDE